MAIELRAVHGDFFLLDEIIEVAAELLAGGLADFCANADRKMIGARKRPQVALELFQEFHFDDVFFGGHEIAERHFEVSCA